MDMEIKSEQLNCGHTVITQLTTRGIDWRLSHGEGTSSSLFMLKRDDIKLN